MVLLSCVGYGCLLVVLACVVSLGQLFILLVAINSVGY